MRGNLNDNQAKIDNADKAVRAALERKRKIIMQSKQIAYDMLSELYGVTGWDCDFRTYKHQGDWQAALGITAAREAREAAEARKQAEADATAEAEAWDEYRARKADEKARSREAAKAAL